VQTVAQAVAELNRLQTQRSDNTLPTLARTPKFNEYSAHYLNFIGSGQGTKKLGTVAKEKALLKRWNNHIGGLRLDQIKRVATGITYVISPPQLGSLFISQSNSAVNIIWTSPGML